MGKKFQRTIQNFKCEVCGKQVIGNGYTNHCPRCLSSKHVDCAPGDRACTCGGIMFATSLQVKHGIHYIVHVCSKCGFQRPNKTAPEDAFEALVALSNGSMDIFLKELLKKKSKFTPGVSEESTDGSCS